MNVALILVNGLVFLYEIAFADTHVFFYTYGLIPQEITAGEPFTRLVMRAEVLDITTPYPTWGTFLTSMFIHASWMHFLGNMLFLWVFGDNIEARIGHVAYLLFYALAGVAAAFTQIFIDPASQIPTIGASGAIAGVLGGYLMLYPHSRINTLVFFYFVTVVRIPALFILGFWILMQFVEGLGSLGLSSQTGGVAYWAHIGGFVTGVAVFWAYKRLFQRASYE